MTWRFWRPRPLDILPAADRVARVAALGACPPLRVRWAEPDARFRTVAEHALVRWVALNDLERMLSAREAARTGDRPDERDGAAHSAWASAEAESMTARDAAADQADRWAAAQKSLT